MRPPRSRRERQAQAEGDVRRAHLRAQPHGRARGGPGDPARHREDPRPSFSVRDREVDREDDAEVVQPDRRAFAAGQLRAQRHMHPLYRVGGNRQDSDLTSDYGISFRQTQRDDLGLA